MIKPYDEVGLWPLAGFAEHLGLRKEILYNAFAKEGLEAYMLAGELLTSERWIYDWADTGWQSERDAGGWALANREMITARTERRRPTQPDVATEERLTWLKTHGHPGLYWLMQGLLLYYDPLSWIAYDARVSVSTIYRYRRIALELLEARNASVQNPPQSHDGRVARGDSTRARIADAIRALTDQHGQPPGVREVQRYIGHPSLSTVQHHLDILRHAGYVRIRERGQRRELVLVRTWPVT